MKTLRPELRFVLFPGIVRSRSDGDIHLVGVGDLIRLYGVPEHRCRVVRGGPDRDFLGRLGENEIGLHPQYSGDYTLPEECYEQS